jgi:hypothetical protein
MLVAVVLATLTLTPIVGMAQIGVQGEDVFGLYTALDNTALANMNTAAGTAIVYMIVTNASAQAGVWGYEMLLTFSPAGILTLINTEYAGQAINVATPPEYSVGLAAPLPWARDVRLATLTFFVAATTPATVTVGPSTIPSVPGELVYVDGGDVGNLIPLNPSSGDQANAIFGFNTGPLNPPIANDEDTWGGVKNLYR